METGVSTDLALGGSYTFTGKAGTDNSRFLLRVDDTTITEIGRRLDKSPQAFSQKCKRNNFTIAELQDIAMVTGCRLECAFVFPNGNRIELGDVKND